MNAEEKITTTLLALYNYSKLRPTSEPFSYNLFNDNSISDIPDHEKWTILEKFEKDFGIIKIIKRPDIYYAIDEDSFTDNNDPLDLIHAGYYEIKISDSFDDYAERHLFNKESIFDIIEEEKQMDADYDAFKKWEGTYQSRDNAFSIEYTIHREVLLNGYFLLGKPDFNSENDLVFNYIIEHPNITLGRKDIEQAIGNPLAKSLHKIIENLGFNNELKTLFFHTTKDAIYFRNPVSKDNLIKLGINKIRIK